MYLQLLFLGLVVVLIVALAIHQDKPLLEHSISHWYRTVDGLSGTTSTFYEAVQERLREQEIPGLVMKVVAFREGGILSVKREYLRVRREVLSYDLCVAPFGKTLFLSSWLCKRPEGVLETCLSVPLLGAITAGLLKLFRPETYYRVDAALMFQGAVHACVLSVLDEMTAAEGLESIPEPERKPVLRELYGPKGRR